MPPIEWKLETEAERAKRLKDNPQQAAYEAWVKMTEANARCHCPLCGRFAKFLSEGRDYQGEWYAYVQCSTHGRTMIE